jgi:hypothetical protein
VIDFERISDALNVIGWFAAGFWFLRGWWIRRDDFPKIRMEASMQTLYAIDGTRLVEVAVTVHNGGEVRHTFTDLVYHVTGYEVESLNREIFTTPVSIVTGKRMFPAVWEYSFVDAGQSSTYRKMVRIPPGVKVIRLEAIMSYSDPESDFHSVIWYGNL